MKLWDSAGAALGLFWSYQGYSIAYVYENYAISNQYTFDHEVVILAPQVLEEKNCRFSKTREATKLHQTIAT